MKDPDELPEQHEEVGREMLPPWLLRVLQVGVVAAMLVSFVITHLIWAELTPWRIAVQLIGLGYNYDIVPTLRGLSRFKEIYFFKNFGSSVLFVLTGFAYPLAVADRIASPASIPPKTNLGALFSLDPRRTRVRRSVERGHLERLPRAIRRVVDPLQMERELYLGMVIDRSTKKPVLMVCQEGGVEIEKVAEETPEKIHKAFIDPAVGLQGFQARQLAFALGLRLQDRLDQRSFNRAVLVFLGGLGAWLVIRSLR